MYHLNKQLNLIKDCNIIWIAITPNRDKQSKSLSNVFKKIYLVIENRGWFQQTKPNI